MKKRVFLILLILLLAMLICGCEKTYKCKECGKAVTYELNNGLCNDCATCVLCDEPFSHTVKALEWDGKSQSPTTKTVKYCENHYNSEGEKYTCITGSSYDKCSDVALYSYLGKSCCEKHFERFCNGQSCLMCKTKNVVEWGSGDYDDYTFCYNCHIKYGDIHHSTYSPSGSSGGSSSSKGPWHSSNVKDDGTGNGPYYCYGKNNTCPNTTINYKDLYCDKCDPDGDNVEG